MSRFWSKYMIWCCPFRTWTTQTIVADIGISPHYTSIFPGSNKTSYSDPAPSNSEATAGQSVPKFYPRVLSKHVIRCPCWEGKKGIWTSSLSRWTKIPMGMYSSNTPAEGDNGKGEGNKKRKKKAHVFILLLCLTSCLQLSYNILGIHLRDRVKPKGKDEKA